MAEDLPALYAVDFSERERERLAGVSFGEGIYGDLVTEWLLGSDCQGSMERGTRVWLFESEDNQIVGVGSLGVSRRPWPPPRGDYRTVLLIPMFGVTAPF